ncbi:MULTISPECIES: alpha/beta hydrolase [Rhodococcus]|uniref:Alpha/beta hydrolase n=1 Tax=Rhodococcus oxybenzonivorans TaxID=1990687 RepID=A0AAE4UW07_9NOCA|nr:MULTISPECIES: alpha/beta hydrolase [Rhodococcus]MDV7244872.1 alpha/beta hydrolase [Rhodococcus oxybenzonivorans]MDV7263671.1 alpha/beta hydrolase [Rhodococcus oxybenzonivorans]MDV7275629.1 alpha/beta hydrolase [Rhodococcus oxybenzonivorans]MDV7332406.1 alpha/beta hydrolase [Rhodococcus oxybenzonivorans]MDV7346202.1 alpha/beta hydrolase [Rhodococcus oxybenzonivorans]
MSNTPVSSEHDGRRLTVRTEDGIPLAVREFGTPDAPTTVVFVHGHCLRTESWWALRKQLVRFWRNEVRMVFYDHRGHGESGEAPASTYTIDQLGRDLGSVLNAVAPRGPIVLVGHSMGGMTALSYARQNPHTIGSRIVGMALISTAAYDLAEAGLARHLRSPAVSLLRSAVRRAPRVVHGSKKLGRTVGTALAKAAEARNRPVDPRLAALVAAMVNTTSVVTMSSFLESLLGFDERASLAALAHIPSLVLCGSVDMLTPFQHSAAMASLLPASQLVSVDGAGHSVILERAADVAAAIIGLVERIAHTAPAASGRELMAVG